MIKYSILAYLFFCLAVPSELIQMRNLYEKLDKNEKATRELDQVTRNAESISPTLKQAYLAVTHMALAQYHINPVSKLKGFNEGKTRLEKAIQEDSSSIEIRYLRLTIQQHAPSIIGYNKNISNDRKYLISSLKLIKKSDSDLFVRIYTYLILECKLSENDKRLINS